MLQYRKADIKAIAIIIILSIVTLAIVYFLNIKSNYDKLEPVNAYNNFFANISYVNNYINALARKNTTKAYDMLDEKYISAKNITSSNILDTWNYSGDVSFRANKMSYVSVDNDFVYYVEGAIHKNSYDSDSKVQDFNVLVLNDFDNMTFSIYPVDDNSLEKVINGIKKIDIAGNGNNVIDGSSFISKEQVCSMYLSDFLRKLDDDVDATYDILSSDMKKSYQFIEEYRDYVRDNYSLLSTSADMCKVENFNDKRIYTVIDKNGNTYIFDEEYILKYNVSFYIKSTE